MSEKNSSLSMPLCITDLLFNVIGFLILLISLSSFEENMELNEKVLQELNLSQQQDLAGMKSSTAKIYINVYIENNTTMIEIDGKKMNLQELQIYLNSLGGAAQVALRCEANVLVGFQDNILAACRKAGIESIDQVVKIEK